MNIISESIYTQLNCWNGDKRENEYCTNALQSNVMVLRQDLQQLLKVVLSRGALTVHLAASCFSVAVRLSLSSVNIECVYFNISGWDPGNCLNMQNLKQR